MRPGFEGTGTLWYAGVGEFSFLRGGCNRDGTVNVADALSAFGALHIPQSPYPLCVSACDANDDSSFNVADAVFTLLHLFVDGAKPPARYPNCGNDPTSPANPACAAYWARP